MVLFVLLAAAIVSADDLSNLAGAGRGVKLVGPVIERALSAVAGVKVLLRSRGLPRARERFVRAKSRGKCGAREIAGAARGLFRSMELRGVTPS